MTEDTNIADRMDAFDDMLASLEERFEQVEATVADLKKLFGRWLNEKVAEAKPLVDTQQMLIDSRAADRKASPPSPIRYGGTR
jgi:hypothetical protein